MSNRTRSNTNFDKMPLSMGLDGVPTRSDRLAVISRLADQIAINQRKMTMAMSYKMPDMTYVAKCKERIQNCLHTVKVELRNIGVKDENLVSKIVSCVENNDFNAARANVLEVLGRYNPMVYGGR